MLAGVLLASCATTPPAGPPLAHPDQPLHLTGRFSISETRTLPDARSQHNSGRFALDRDARRLSFTLFSPFGQTIARASQQQGQPAWLETARHQRFSGDTLEQVLTHATGISVPVSRLPLWLSDRFQQVIERSADGRRIRAREDDWQIERHDRQWYLVRHHPAQRLEIRLALDPTPQPATGTPATSSAGQGSAPRQDDARGPAHGPRPADSGTATPPAADRPPSPGHTGPGNPVHPPSDAATQPDQPIVFPPDDTLPDPIPRAPGRACPDGPAPTSDALPSKPPAPPTSRPGPLHHPISPIPATRPTTNRPCLRHDRRPAPARPRQAQSVPARHRPPAGRAAPARNRLPVHRPAR